MLLGDEVGLAGDGSEHASSARATDQAAAVRRASVRPERRSGESRVSYARCIHAAGRAAPRPGPRSRRRSCPCSSPASASSTPARRCAPSPSRPRRSCSSPWSPGSLLRHGPAGARRAGLQPVPAELGLRRQHHRPRSTGSVAIIDAYRVAEYLNAVRRRAATAGSGRRACRVDPLSIAGLAGRPPGHGRRPRRRRPLRHARPRRARAAAASSSATDVEPRVRRGRHRVAGSVGHRRADRRADRQRTDSPSRRIGSARARRLDPAVGRQGAPEHPAHRRRQAGRRPPHRHADHGVDRPGHQAGRDVQPAARHGRRAGPAGPAAVAVGPRLPPEDQQLLRPELQPRRTSGRASRATRGYNGLKAMLGELYGLDIKYFVEVDFDGLQGRRRRARRRDRQRPDPGRRRHATRRRGPQHAAVHPERAPAHERHPGPALRALAPHLDATSTAARASSASSCRCASRPTRRCSCPACRSSSRRSRARSGPTSRSTSSPKLLGLATEIDTTNIRSYVFSPPLYSQRHLPATRAAASSCPRSRPIRTSVENAFKVDPELEARREALAAEAAKVWVVSGLSDRRRRDTAGRLPRAPGPGGVRPASQAGRCRPGRHEDRRLQRGRGRPRPDDRLPRAALQGRGRAGERPGRSAPTSSSRSGATRPTSAAALVLRPAAEPIRRSA